MLLCCYMMVSSRNQSLTTLCELLSKRVCVIDELEPHHSAVGQLLLQRRDMLLQLRDICLQRRRVRLQLVQLGKILAYLSALVGGGRKGKGERDRVESLRESTQLNTESGFSGGDSYVSIFGFRFQV